MEKVITTLVWAALIQGFLLAMLYLFSKKHRSLANRLLGLFLLVIVYEGTLAFIPYNDILGYPIDYFTLPEVKLFYPLLFLHYILEKVGATKRYLLVLRIHYILASLIAGIALISISLFFIKGITLKSFFGEESVEFFFMAHQYYAFILIIIAFVFSILEVRLYKKVIQKEYSDFKMLNINWLWRLIFVLLPIIIVWGINLIFIALGSEDSFSIELVTWAFVIVFLYFVSFQAFKHKNLFEGIEERRSEPLNKNILKSKQDFPSISEQSELKEEDKKLIQRIKKHMTNQEPYLDASLSIYQLANQVDIPVRDLSLLINHKLNKHFFDFVNEYRIQKATEILKDPQHQKMTILEILYEVGFNSKSSFNTVFKKYTGLTPTQYRKNNQLVKK